LLDETICYALPKRGSANVNEKTLTTNRKLKVSKSGPTGKRRSAKLNVKRVRKGRSKTRGRPKGGKSKSKK